MVDAACTRLRTKLIMTGLNKRYKNNDSHRNMHVSLFQAQVDSYTIKMYNKKR